MLPPHVAFSNIKKKKKKVIVYFHNWNCGTAMTDMIFNLQLADQMKC